MKSKKKKAHVVLWSILTSVSAILMTILLIGTPIAQSYATVINIYFGVSSHEIKKGESNVNTEYFKSSFENDEERFEYEEQLAEQLEGEGATLLMNKNNALPLSEGAKVSLFSHSSADLVYGGTGSANSDFETAATLKGAMEDSGFAVNETLWEFYDSEEIRENYARRDIAGLYWDDYLKYTPAYLVNEVPWKTVEEKAGKSFEEYGDAAVMVLSRVGGEGSDLPCGDNGSGLEWISNGEGDGNYLELSPEEKDTLVGLKELKDEGVFKKIIVLLNSSNAIELDFLDAEICGVDYGVDAALWIGDVGYTGINGVADLLAGIRVPSGSLVDTYCYDNLTSPAIRNFYTQLFTNWEEAGLGYGDYEGAWGLSKNYNTTNMNSVYQEGIYIGYRYYETRYEDMVMETGNAGDYDYGRIVARPFGYGLSYTDFEYSNFKAKEKEDVFEISVDVTNTGDTWSGKKTVQVYFQSPYTDYDIENKIEKASIELCGYAKTDILAPGKTESVTIEVDKEELRAYDSNNAKTYILEDGDYYFTIGNGAHDALNNVLAAKGYSVDNTDGRMDKDGNKELVFKWTNDRRDTKIFAISAATGVEIKNQLDQSDPNKNPISPGEVTWLTRSDWEGTFPQENYKWEATEEIVKALEYTTYDKADYEEMEMPVMNADNGMTLAMMIGRDYDDPDWEKLLDQVSFEEMARLITLAGHCTEAIPSVAKPYALDENGPTGITATLTLGEAYMCYTSEDIMAATFNDELMYEVGRCIGEDALAVGYSGLYGPAADTHRTPYSGRNFEYYSEDPFIAGHICANEVQGIQKSGVYVFLKHFALNDSESYRFGVCTWVNEQAAREIYLQAFETPITEGGAWCVMNSLSRWGFRWSGEYKELQTNILRDEWGLPGINLTDWSAENPYEDVADGLMGGTNAWDSTYEPLHTKELRKYENDEVIVNEMRESTKRIFYTVANSNAMNGMSSDDRIVKITPWWEMALKVFRAVFILTTIGCVIMLVKAIKRKKEMKAEL